MKIWLDDTKIHVFYSNSGEYFPLYIMQKNPNNPRGKIYLFSEFRVPVSTEKQAVYLQRKRQEEI